MNCTKTDTDKDNSENLELSKKSVTLHYKTSKMEENKKEKSGCTGWIIIVFMLLVIGNLRYCIKEQVPSVTKVYEVVVDKTNYDICLNNIKGTEGFVDTVYKCPSGYPTIGYGHQVKRGEKFTKITKFQADSILASDFDLSIKESYRITGFTGNKCLALAHFFFAFGTNKYGNSKLRSLLTRSELKRSEIESEWLSWCNYKDTKNEWHEVPALKKARKFEVDLFFSK